MSILSGEWWLDSSGMATFADGDVGDYNHAMIAFQAALGIDLDLPEAPELIPFESFSQEALKYLKKHNANSEAINYLKDGSDPRDYALEYMGWIRVHGDNFQVWDFNDDALDKIKNSDVWEQADSPEELEDSDEHVLIEQSKNNKSWSVPLKVLFKAQSAEGLKRYMEGIGKWRNNPTQEKNIAFYQEPVQVIARVRAHDATRQPWILFGLKDREDGFEIKYKLEHETRWKKYPIWFAEYLNQAKHILELEFGDYKTFQFLES